MLSLKKYDGFVPYTCPLCGTDHALGSSLLGDPLARHGHVIVQALSTDNPTRI